MVQELRERVEYDVLGKRLLDLESLILALASTLGRGGTDTLPKQPLELSDALSKQTKRGLGRL